MYMLLSVEDLPQKIINDINSLKDSLVRDIASKTRALKTKALKTQAFTMQ